MFIHRSSWVKVACEGGGKEIDVNDNQQDAEDAPQQGTAQLQIIGSNQHHNEIEVQEDQLIGGEVADAGSAEQNEKDKDLFKVSEQVLLEMFQEQGRS